MVRDRVSVTIYHQEVDMDFRFVSTSMTLEGVIALILRFSANSIAFLTKYVTVVEYKPIMSVNIVFQFQSSTFGYNKPTLQRILSMIA